MDGCSIALLLAVLIGAGAIAWRHLSDRLEKIQAELDDVKLDVYSLRRDVADRAPEPQPEAPAAQPAEEQPTEERVSPTALPQDTATPEPLEPITDRPAAEVGARVPLEPPPIEPISPPSPDSQSSFPSVDWERWIGVRGAAVLGGIVLALAALLFLKYSVEHGLIPPIVRVIAGVVGGIGAIWGSEMLRRRQYETTANSLAGSGVVILYAAFWAANRLYGLIPTVPAFGLMILVTVACGMLAWRHNSLVIAVLGLVGGFATPLLLATTQENPLGLFFYLLLLDTGLLILARKRGWPILGALGLLATFFHQALWILLKMPPERLWLGLLILASFTALFALMAPRSRTDSDATGSRTWQGIQIAGVLLPFVFALYFAANAELGEHLWAVACFLLVLSVAAAWISRLQNIPWIAAGAAAASIAVVLAWMARTRFESALAWEAVTIAAALALVFHLFDEFDLRRGTAIQESPFGHLASLVAAGGFFILLIGGSLTRVPSLWPWLVGWSLLATMLVRQAALPHSSYRQILAAGLLGSGFALYFGVHGGTLALPPSALYFGLVIVACLLFQMLARQRRDGVPRVVAEWAAVLIPAIVLAGLLVEAMEPSLGVGLYHLTTITLALLLILVGTRLTKGAILFATMIVLLAMGAQLAAVALFVVWPFLTVPRFTGDRWAWSAAALAPVAWFLSLQDLYSMRFGSSAIGLLPLGLGAVSLVAAFRLRRVFATDDPQRIRNLAWFAAVALGFLSVAIPLQLDKEWITIGWALEGVAVIVLWKYLDHPGLKYFGLALLGAVTVRLVANPALFGYHPQTAWPIFNWLMYTYLIPAIALLASATVLRQLELGRARDWERSAFAKGYPPGAIACALAAILVTFVWLNLTIFDAFSPGTALAISFDRLPARDLTLSIAWALYALILLAVGMVKRSQGLRWISLAFIVLTIGKVFLYDLGELKDLYRVASLMGLAISLILVSLAYQRFVFRRIPKEQEE